MTDLNEAGPPNSELIEYLRSRARRDSSRIQVTDILDGLAADRIAALSAEVERLQALADGYGKLDADLALAERRAEASEAQVATLTNRLDEAAKVIEPFAEAAGEYFALNYNDRDVVSVLMARKDGKLIEEAKLTFGHLRAARSWQASRGDK